ncbi:polymer-forming cytoskeletal protein [Oceanidesulfovibrio indonesiensis]|uniref:Polymer-forming cytoskeletal protein n=1 Tax=Oceanidesulfovibrio indonesiensis TaxID=54767 RepID=A0A7M3MEY9_9BACT|nr:polymer-forming cytoskeletal protein [Oceanidesulfovibrio indonesiensis]TVM17581.1 polymer-forming cytoskeletal protein [Oceanidesulfovibrio indonesiensis]
MAKDEINAFLGSGTAYEGKLNFQGSVRVDGSFTGEIQSEGTLIVGKDARVQGKVWVGQLIMSGHFQGEILASKKVVLHKTANLLGSLNTPVLVIEEGAVMEGQVSMGTADSGKSKSRSELKAVSSMSKTSEPESPKDAKESAGKA